MKIKILPALRLFFFYVGEVILSNLKVAYDIVTPAYFMNPAIVAVPLDEDLSETELYLLSNLITMTPGTLSLDISHDCRCLYIHSMYTGSPEEVRADAILYMKKIKEVSR
ncbi:MAG: Na+/H+ antiporter subunit E [Verrucomicrobiota bacterium]